MTEDKDPLKELLSQPGALYELPVMEEGIMVSVREVAALQERAARHRRHGLWALVVCFGLFALCWWLTAVGASYPYRSPWMGYVLSSFSLLLLFAQLETRWKSKESSSLPGAGS